MEKPKIDKILIENLELIDSRTINVFSNTFDIFVENISFHFEFVEDRREEKYTVIEKIEENVFKVSFFSFREGGFQGILKPEVIGVIDDMVYWFTVSCTLNKNRIHKSITFNLFQETK